MSPDAVYQTCRYGTMHCELPNLRPEGDYLLRLHFATHHTQPVRICDVVVNGETMLSDYDIMKESGGKMKAVVEELNVKAYAQGKLVIKFVTKVDQALVNGIELLATGTVKKEH